MITPRLVAAAFVAGCLGGLVADRMKWRPLTGLLLGALLGLLIAALPGCAFDAEPQKACWQEATIGCGPGCPPRVVQEAIVCPGAPVDGGG